MKEKFSIQLPTVAEFTAGLTARELHPALATAEQALRDAERDHAAAKDRLAELTREVEALPARVRRGEASPADLERAIAAQRAHALTLPHFERTVAEMREQLRAETARASVLLREEVDRRLGVLRDVAERIAPVLETIRTLELELSHRIDKRFLGLGLDWPRSWRDELERRGMSNVIAQFNLESAGFKSYADAAWNRKKAAS